MSECIGEGCTDPEHYKTAREERWTPTGRKDNLPPGIDPAKWERLSRAERRAFARRVRRG